jgi:hypothetical protein
LNQDQTIQPDTFGRHWLVLAIVGLALWFAYRHATKVPVLTPVVRETTVPANANWFLVLRMPAVTSQYESGIETMKGRYGAWLDALAKGDYHPMKLSEVHRRLQAGDGLPPKTVVMVFDPGARRTYETIAPILASLWLTPKVEMDQGHREYLTYRQTNLMIDSDAWDIGLIQKDGSLILKSKDAEPIHLGNDRTIWVATAGGMALNRGKQFLEMNRLNVNADWLPKDLMNRVTAEVPVERPMYLTQGSVQNLNWGVVTDPSSSEEKHFDVTLASHRRGTQLAWMGTREHRNFELEAKADAIVGRMAFHLRWNERDESGIIVTVSNQDVRIRHQANGTSRDVQTLTRSGAGPRRPLSLVVKLQQNDLRISVDGRLSVAFVLPPEAPSGSGLLQLNVYDAIKGSARVDGLQLLYSPLP